MLTWDVQPVALKLRGYLPEAAGGYEARAAYSAVLDIMLLGGGVAYAHGAMVGDGVKLTRSDMRAIALKLAPYGVTRLLAERDGVMVEWLSPDTKGRPMGLDGSTVF